MDKFKEIRPVVLGIATKNNKILVEKGYNSKDQVFYRPNGGGIEFLEKSEDALKREFKEELNIDIKVGEYLGLVENIFNYKGKDAHELILLYRVEIDDKDFKEEYLVNEDGEESISTWIDIDKFKNNELIIHPKEILKYV